MSVFDSSDELDSIALSRTEPLRFLPWRRPAARFPFAPFSQSDTENKLVDSLYTSLLGRPADPHGEAFFVTSLAAGMTVEQAKALILGSSEYYRHAGESAFDLVLAMGQFLVYGGVHSKSLLALGFGKGQHIFKPRKSREISSFS